MSVVLLVLTLLSLVYEAAALVSVVRALCTVPKLSALQPPEPPAWPRVSLIIPARDEGSELGAALASRLEDDYPALEVLVVNDRSTDETGEIADAAARRDARVRVEHIRALPDGWIGKVHAMHVGVLRATGSWILLSDADVHFAPGTLRRAIAYAESVRADHISVMPCLHARTFLVGVMQAVFLRSAASGGRLYDVANPRSNAAVGGGLFNLIRRSALDRTPGLEFLRMEVIDDLALGQMLKAHGGVARVVNACDCIALDFYESVVAFIKGMEKNAIALVGGFSVLRLVAATSIMALLELLPCVMLLVPSSSSTLSWATKAAAALACTVATTSSELVNRWLKRPLFEALLWPLGVGLMVIGFLRSGWLAWIRGGIVWRDTRYPSHLLRAGQRVRPF